MHRRIAAAVLVLTSGLAFGADIARACGDKFLVIGGTAAHKYSSVHPSKILVLKRNADLAIDSPNLETSLVRAGHRPKLVASQAALAQALAKDNYAAVLVDLADAKAVSSQVAAAPSQPQLVVLSDPTAAPVAAASQDYACLIKTPETAKNFLSALDDFLRERKAALKASQKN